MASETPLPKGWTKKVVLRQSGASAGKTDTYFYSPEGKKFRSRTEIAKYCKDKGLKIDVESFTFGGKVTSPAKKTPAKETPTTSRGRGRPPKAAAKEKEQKTPGKLVVKMQFSPPKKRSKSSDSSSKEPAAKKPRGRPPKAKQEVKVKFPMGPKAAQSPKKGKAPAKKERKAPAVKKPAKPVKEKKAKPAAKKAAKAPPKAKPPAKVAKPTAPKPLKKRKAPEETGTAASPTKKAKPEKTPESPSKSDKTGESSQPTEGGVVVLDELSGKGTEKSEEATEPEIISISEAASGDDREMSPPREGMSPEELMPSESEEEEDEGFVIVDVKDCEDEPEVVAEVPPAAARAPEPPRAGNIETLVFRPLNTPEKSQGATQQQAVTTAGPVQQENAAVITPPPEPAREASNSGSRGSSESGSTTYLPEIIECQAPAPGQAQTLLPPANTTGRLPLSRTQSWGSNIPEPSVSPLPRSISPLTDRSDNTEPVSAFEPVFPQGVATTTRVLGDAASGGNIFERLAPPPPSSDGGVSTNVAAASEEYRRSAFQPVVPPSLGRQATNHCAVPPPSGGGSAFQPVLPSSAATGATTNGEGRGARGREVETVTNSDGRGDASSAEKSEVSPAQPIMPPSYSS